MVVSIKRNCPLKFYKKSFSKWVEWSVPFSGPFHFPFRLPFHFPFRRFVTAVLALTKLSNFYFTGDSKGTGKGGGGGGTKENKNKNMFIPESMKKIKIKVIFIVISFIIFFEKLEDS